MRIACNVFNLYGIFYFVMLVLAGGDEKDTALASKEQAKDTEKPKEGEDSEKNTVNAKKEDEKQKPGFFTRTKNGIKNFFLWFVPNRFKNKNKKEESSTATGKKSKVIITSKMDPKKGDATAAQQADTTAAQKADTTAAKQADTTAAQKDESDSGTETEEKTNINPPKE
ncbi:hypothetical protein EDEG_02955 [Edhazardia aedis USNM 41457]|uniref:Uncharacterized protein n=1 Tax=Edhazardia aedis (strain USNM 41457) TaxID=1003232 RepID=J9DJ60_EDHAE|nr:hypothetical protein EDEG_02955 [Edhazardia aedis USNM 41457]|eukprot:EJW02635.1 hypothetical protein EDEG_02955 [Edhazardia aedis USNM 41457]